MFYPPFHFFFEKKIIKVIGIDHLFEAFDADGTADIFFCFKKRCEEFAGIGSSFFCEKNDLLTPVPRAGSKRNVVSLLQIPDRRMNGLFGQTKEFADIFLGQAAPAVQSIECH